VIGPLQLLVLKLRVKTCVIYDTDDAVIKKPLKAIQHYKLSL